MEARTRETYTYYLERHILPVFGSMRINEIQPADVREWVTDLKAAGASPTVIRQCHTILSAVFTTAFNDQITRLHPCRGVKTPPVAKKLRTIITPDQFDQLYTALPTDPARLLAELLIESGLRWAELTELRPADLNRRMRMLTVSRVAVELVARFHPTGGRFLIKDYPKDREHRRIKLAAHIADQLQTHITDHGLGPNDLLFTPTVLLPQAEPSPLEIVKDEIDLGLTRPNSAGRRYRHGTISGYSGGGCKCEHCYSAYAKYRAQRRAGAKTTREHPAPSHHRRAHPALLVPRTHLEPRPTTPPASPSKSEPTTYATPTIRLIETCCGMRGLVVASEGCDGLVLDPSADRGVWLVNEVPARRVPPVAWL